MKSSNMGHELHRLWSVQISWQHVLTSKKPGHETVPQGAQYPQGAQEALEYVSFPLKL